MSTVLFIPWYWAPYIVALGAWDWWLEVTQVTHQAALHQGATVLRQEKHTVVRSIASLILLCTVVLFVARDLIAPWLGSGAFHPSSGEILWGSAALAVAGLLGGLWLIGRALFLRLRGLYRRGLKRLLRARAAQA
jgi:hypothetical protein